MIERRIAISASLLVLGITAAIVANWLSSPKDNESHHDLSKHQREFSVDTRSAELLQRLNAKDPSTLRLFAEHYFLGSPPNGAPTIPGEEMARLGDLVLELAERSYYLVWQSDSHRFGLVSKKMIIDLATTEAGLSQSDFNNVHIASSSDGYWIVTFQQEELEDIEVRLDKRQISVSTNSM